MADLLPVLIYFAAVLGIVASMWGGSHFLGPRHRDNATEEPFESGIVPVGDARFRMSVAFYLMAIFFVIFDLEVVYLFAWAVAFEEAGWLGFIEALIFIVILLAGLVYLWKIGALEWRTKRQIEQVNKRQAKIDAVLRGKAKT